MQLNGELLLPPANVCKGYVSPQGGLPHCMLGYPRAGTTHLGRHPPPPGQAPSLGRHPSEQAPPWANTPLGRHPQADTLGRHPPGQTPPGETPPWADTPLGRHPPEQDPSLGKHPPGQTTPRAVHAGIRSISGRYASQWNAILFYSCSAN